MDVKHGDIITMSHFGEANSMGIVVGIHPELEMLAVAWYFPTLNTFDLGMVKFTDIGNKGVRIMQSDDEIFQEIYV